MVLFVVKTLVLYNIIDCLIGI